tara:strand:- start:10 stop:606 length:597 start_codon:yes stop_codon:yes gene_type:complete
MTTLIRDPFIWAKDDVVPSDICEEAIYRFEKYKDHHQQGIIGGRYVDTNVKDSQDLGIENSFEFADICKVFNDSLQREIHNYHAWCGRITRKCFNTGKDMSLTIDIPPYFQLSHQIQKTPPGKGYIWHSDAFSTRILTYIFYLNTVDEGWTEFWQGDKVAPRQGRLLIFPCDTTYFHQGFPPKQDKYISIGWLTGVLP